MCNFRANFNDHPEVRIPSTTHCGQLEKLLQMRWTELHKPVYSVAYITNPLVLLVTPEKDFVAIDELNCNTHQILKAYLGDANEESCALKQLQDL